MDEVEERAERKRETTKHKDRMPARAGGFVQAPGLEMEGTYLDIWGKVAMDWLEDQH